MQGNWNNKAKNSYSAKSPKRKPWDNKPERVKMTKNIFLTTTTVTWVTAPIKHLHKNQNPCTANMSYVPRKPSNEHWMSPTTNAQCSNSHRFLIKSIATPKESATKQLDALHSTTRVGEPTLVKRAGSNPSSISLFPSNGPFCWHPW